MLKYNLRKFNIEKGPNSDFFPAINGVKGLIMVMIVITHSLPDSMISFYMYLFHMPLFMAMSGFLLKESTFKNGGLAYFKKIFIRLGIPWIIASIIYIPIQNIYNNSSFKMENLLYPFYHLWYIPAYILGSFVCFKIIRRKINILPVLLISAFITIGWYMIFRDKHIPDKQMPLFFFGDKRFYCYLVFFVMGFGLRNGLLIFKTSFTGLLFINLSTLVLLSMCVYAKLPDWISVMPYMFFNFSIATIFLKYLAPFPLFQSKLFLHLNKQSLGIYLYHPMIILIIYTLLNDSHKTSTNNSAGFIVAAITLVGIILFIELLKKLNFTSRFILGNIKTK